MTTPPEASQSRDKLTPAMIRELRARAESAERTVEGLRRALRFYANAERYIGANQNPVPGDEFQPADLPYRLDITRDCGNIARAALAKVQS